jgi:glycosyltransferase involved in cell wall biosynthesis
MRLAICIITRRRPEPLARLLRSLESMHVPDGVEPQLVIVENDEPGRTPTPTTTMPCVHEFETRPGIPAARNRTLDLSLADDATEAIIFLDDDETVDEDWLDRLVAGRRRFGTPIVTGPALPRVPDGSPSWIEASGVLEPPRYPTGTRRPWAFTHNAMVDAAILRDGGHRFDESMVHTGGSDKEFFRRLADAGHQIVWLDDAIAREWYPAERLTHRWVFQRSYRLGTNAPHAEGRTTFGSRVALLWRAVRFAIRGLLRLAIGLSRPQVGLAHAAWDWGRTFGLIAGVAGRRYDEYAERHR